MCTHGPWPGLCNKSCPACSWLMRKAMVWQLQISLQELRVDSQSKNPGSGQLVGQLCFLIRLFLRNPRFGFKRSKSVPVHRQAIPATVTGDTQFFIFSSGGGRGRGGGGQLSQRRSGLIRVFIFLWLCQPTGLATPRPWLDSVINPSMAQ